MIPFLGGRALEATPFQETIVVLFGPTLLSSLSTPPPISDTTPAVFIRRTAADEIHCVDAHGGELVQPYFSSSAVAFGGFWELIWFLFMVILKATKGAPNGDGSGEDSVIGA